MQLHNDLLLQTISGKNTKRTPVWLMRQAGRILPQYRAVREKLSGFKELVETPELACEVTLQPVDELDVDAAIIFSDILVVCDAMGCRYEMEEKKGPIFPQPLKNENDIDRLRIADGQHDIAYTINAIQLCKKALNGRVPLIGFAGAPWTLLAYMVEGSTSKTFAQSKQLLYSRPELAHNALHKITESIINYLKAQVNAGADVVQIFDSWASYLGPHQYREFALPYLNRICAALQPLVPVTLFAKGANYALSEIDQMPCSVVGLDWTILPTEARRLVPNKVLQGNIDPCLLYASPQYIKQATIEMLRDFGHTHHIANLGHGVYPDTPLDNVKVFVDTVKNYRFA